MPHHPLTENGAPLAMLANAAAVYGTVVIGRGTYAPAEAIRLGLLDDRLAG